MRGCAPRSTKRGATPSPSIDAVLLMMEEPARAAVLRLGALACLARAHVPRCQSNFAILSHPEGKAPH